MNTKEAIVLAGGLGTRLQGMLPDIPKCMAPVNGKPFLAYAFDYLINQEIYKVIVSVGYRREQIISYFGNSYNTLIIEYAIEEEPLGTGGAAKLAYYHCTQDQVFVINGDTYFLPDLRAMENHHIQKSADITIAVKQLPETDRFGLIEFNPQGRVIQFKEKEPSCGSGWINGGIYLINRKVFDDFPGEKFSLENDIFKVSCSRLKMQAFQSDAFFLDMGIPEDYEKARNMIKTTGNI